MDHIFKRLSCLALALALCGAGMHRSVQAVQYNGSEAYALGRYQTALEQVRLTGDQRTDLVRIARSQVGYQEGNAPQSLSGEVPGSKDYTEYGSWYGDREEWSCTFVGWCANLAGISTNLIPGMNHANDMLDWYAARGLAYSREEIRARQYIPQPGDLVFFKSHRTAKAADRVGIITDYYNDRIYTLEGNGTAPGLATDGGMVCSRIYPISNTYISYICTPNYIEGSTRVLPQAGLLQQKLRVQALRTALFMTESGEQPDYGKITTLPNGSQALGAGQWYGVAAGELLQLLGQAPGNSTEEKLASPEGMDVQNRFMDRQLERSLEEAEALGLTQPDASTLYAAIAHLGGQSVALETVHTAQDLTAQALLDALARLQPGLVRSCRLLIK